MCEGHIMSEEKKEGLEDLNAPKHLTERRKILDEPNPNRPKTVMQSTFLDDITKVPRDLKSQLAKYMNPQLYKESIQKAQEKQNVVTGRKYRTDQGLEAVYRDMDSYEQPGFADLVSMGADGPMSRETREYIGDYYDNMNNNYQVEMDNALDDEVRRATVVADLMRRSQRDPTNRLGLLPYTDRLRLMQEPDRRRLMQQISRRELNRQEIRELLGRDVDIEEADLFANF